MSKTWDRENMKTLGVNLKKNEAEAFQKLAAENGTTVGAMLRAFIQGTLDQEKEAKESAADRVQGIAHIVSYKNTDRLKHEVAHHNPKGINPDAMLNEILDQYFAFVKKVRV